MGDAHARALRPRRTALSGSQAPSRANRAPLAGRYVAVGAAVRAAHAGVDAARLALFPARVVVRSSLLAPFAIGVARLLEASGRELEAKTRQRAERGAARLVDAPETARTIDRLVAGPVPDVASETVDRVAHRVAESPMFTELVREAADGQATQDLIRAVLCNPSFERTLEDVLSRPAVRAAATRQTRTLADEVTERVRDLASRADDAVTRRVRSALGRRAEGSSAYGGLVARGAAVTADAAIIQAVALALFGAAAVLAWLFGLSISGDAAGVLGATAWAACAGAYFVFFWSTVGQTPGLRLLGLRVCELEGGGVGLARALLRLVVAALAVAPLCAGMLPALVDSRRRTLQDYAARTVVVRESGSQLNERRAP